MFTKNLKFCIGNTKWAPLLSGTYCHLKNELRFNIARGPGSHNPAQGHPLLLIFAAFLLLKKNHTFETVYQLSIPSAVRALPHD